VLGNVGIRKVGSCTNSEHSGYNMDGRLGNRANFRHANRPCSLAVRDVGEQRCLHAPRERWRAAVVQAHCWHAMVASNGA
jgi:hypothetical protein